MAIDPASRWGSRRKRDIHMCQREGKFFLSGRTLSFCLVFAFLAFGLVALYIGPSAEPVRMNQLQVIGTHNSYHIAPAESMLGVIGTMNKRWRDAFDYTHRPLTEQFEVLGVRQIELDVFADPEGGLYSKPGLFGLSGANVDPDEVMKKPGMKVLHVQDLDFRTTALTLKQALTEVRDWSKSNPRHVPVMILIELKDSQPNRLLTKPVAFDRVLLEAVDAEIMAVFQPHQIVLPDDVRAGEKTLREAVLSKGWPTLDSVRGKVMFALDNGGAIRDRYIDGNPSLEGRVMFASVGEQDPGAAFFKVNDPVGRFAKIQRLVETGFIVRTRADAGSAEARRNDTSRREKAFASGAQFVSTDYPEADVRMSDYCVQFEKRAVVRANPVSGIGVKVSE